MHESTPPKLCGVDDCKRPAQPGRGLCAAHIERLENYRECDAPGCLEEAQPLGLFCLAHTDPPSCGVEGCTAPRSGAHARLCAEHASEAREAATRAAIDAEACVSCGDPAEDGGKRCAECAERHRAECREYYRRTAKREREKAAERMRKLRLSRAIAGACVDCGAPAGGYTRCEKHRKRAAERAGAKV